MKDERENDLENLNQELMEIKGCLANMISDFMKQPMYFFIFPTEKRKIKFAEFNQYLENAHNNDQEIKNENEKTRVLRINSAKMQPEVIRRGSMKIPNLKEETAGSRQRKNSEASELKLQRNSYTPENKTKNPDIIGNLAPIMSLPPSIEKLKKVKQMIEKYPNDPKTEIYNEELKNIKMTQKLKEAKTTDLSIKKRTSDMAVIPLHSPKVNSPRSYHLVFFLINKRQGNY